MNFELLASLGTWGVEWFERLVSVGGKVVAVVVTGVEVVVETVLVLSTATLITIGVIVGIVVIAGVVYYVLSREKTITETPDDGKKLCVPSPDFMEWFYDNRRLGNLSLFVTMGYNNELYWLAQCASLDCDTTCNARTLGQWLDGNTALTENQRITFRNKHTYLNRNICRCMTKKELIETYQRRNINKGRIPKDFVDAFDAE